MSNLIQLLQENQRLKNQLNKLKQTNNLTPYINDNIILYIERFEIMYKENSYTKTS